MKEKTKKFSLNELCGLVEMTRRTVRYYIQEELVSKPKGSGRGAFYCSEHLEQLLEIKKWQGAGLSLDRIRDLLKRGEDGLDVPPPLPRKRGSIEVWSHIVINDGVELHIEPGKAGLTPEQLRELSREIIKTFDNIKKRGD